MLWMELLLVLAPGLVAVSVSLLLVVLWVSVVVSKLLRLLLRLASRLVRELLLPPSAASLFASSPWCNSPEGTG